MNSNDFLENYVGSNNSYQIIENEKLGKLLVLSQISGGNGALKLINMEKFAEYMDKPASKLMPLLFSKFATTDAERDAITNMFLSEKQSTTGTFEQFCLDYNYSASIKNSKLSKREPKIDELKTGQNVRVSIHKVNGNNIDEQELYFCDASINSENSQNFCFINMNETTPEARNYGLQRTGLSFLESEMGRFNIPYIRLEAISTDLISSDGSIGINGVYSRLGFEQKTNEDGEVYFEKPVNAEPTMN